MPKKSQRIFVTSILIAIAATDETEAEEKVSGILTENLKLNGEIVDWDWKYNKDAPDWKDKGKYSEKKYVEGSAFESVS